MECYSTQRIIISCNYLQNMGACVDLIGVYTHCYFINKSPLLRTIIKKIKSQSSVHNIHMTINKIPLDVTPPYSTLLINRLNKHSYRFFFHIVS